MKRIKSERVKLKTKRIFIRKGTCSRTFFFILDREFGHPLPAEERAIDPLAGGILQQGYQCGMIWGASMAIGAESFRRYDNHNKAIGSTILATKRIIESFVNETKSIECEKITNCDFLNRKSFAKYFLSGKFINCYKLAGRWAPEAIEVAKEGLSIQQKDVKEEPISCASETIRKMGGSEQEIVMVGGFAGGLGLSGNGCGALAATIWMKTLSGNRKKSKKPKKKLNTDSIIEAFYKETDYEMECKKICGEIFKTLDDHTKFVKNGGCEKLINLLADSNNHN